MKLLVCGDRNWDDRDHLYRMLDAIHNVFIIDLIIEGEARGADRLARWWADSRGIPVLPFPAKWEEHGKAAGPIRNREMLRDGEPEMVAAFHSNLSQSKGTLDMVRLARAAGVLVKVFNGRDDDGETWIDSLVSGAYV